MFGKERPQVQPEAAPMPEPKKLPRIEPKAVITLKAAKEISDTMGGTEKRLIFKVYGIATNLRNTETGGMVLPRFGGNFEVSTPGNGQLYTAKYCYLPVQIQGQLVEKVKAWKAVEFVASVYLVRSETKFAGFEYVGEFNVIQKADPIAALRKKVTEGTA